MALELSERLETPRVIVRSKFRATARWARRLLAAVDYRLEKRRSRRILCDLTEDELRDVGLTRAQARAETAKSWFWS
ncbi:protein of unknown function (DUF1127) [Rhizobium leguminosarum bv. trifolii WSM597]|uniref:YjiS-like domain-containing protein n=1 Tax=Rhizobium leguminosarum bv. trifolii WSM597 TaxID=754764 RepID=J0H081_RHILT|nr:DUF1127 domain-containing protein [Rhizobium leguminosarum]EJB03308.1 protein of unknown function (DUF1127) [Rhizobium leguminosarum bv. trifolii WSM597]